jgi:hypothetical protein
LAGNVLPKKTKTAAAKTKTANPMPTTKKLFAAGRAVPAREFAAGFFSTNLEPVSIYFCVSDAGACGAVIFWKHVGQSITVPACDASQIICWPQTGHANLNSLMLRSKHFISARGRQCAF